MARGLLAFLFGEHRASPENPSTSLSNPEAWLYGALGGGDDPGDAVTRSITPRTALHLTPYWSGVRLLSETIGSLPLHVYERLDVGRRRADAHPAYALLHDAPNEYTTAINFRETLTAHCINFGNGYAEIERRGDGRPYALWPLLPDRTRPVALPDGRRAIITEVPDGGGWRPVPLPADDVLHIQGLGFDGWVGYPVVTMFRRALGLAMATEQYGVKFFSNGARPGGVLEHPGKLTPAAKLHLKASWDEAHQGLDQAQRVAVLEEGMKYATTSMQNDDAQFLETRKFQVSEIARLLRVPPHMIGDLEKATFSNIEQQSLDFVIYSLRAWLVRWEQAIQRRLFLPGERARFYAEHNVEGLLRGDTASRNQAYALGRQWGWLSADDIRERENMNPLPDGAGAIYLSPLNMGIPTPAGVLPPTPAALPAPAPRSLDPEVWRPLLADAQRRIDRRRQQTAKKPDPDATRSHAAAALAPIIRAALRQMERPLTDTEAVLGAVVTSALEGTDPDGLVYALATALTPPEDLTHAA